MSRRLAALTLTVLLSACATTPVVHFDSDPSANFASLRTYSWAYQSAPPGVNPLQVERVRVAIDNTLTARGFTKAESSDFAVGFTLGRRDRVVVTDLGLYGPTFHPWGGWGWGGWGGWSTWRQPQVEVRNVSDGLLVIDIYDTRTRAPIWHGTATQEIRQNTATVEQVNAAVAAVLANFPPPPPRR